MKKKKLRALLRQSSDRCALSSNAIVEARKEGFHAGIIQGKQDGQVQVAHAQDCIRAYAMQVFGSRIEAEADEAMHALLKAVGTPL